MKQRLVLEHHLPVLVTHPVLGTVLHKFSSADFPYPTSQVYEGCKWANKGYRCVGTFTGSDRWMKAHAQNVVYMFQRLLSGPVGKPILFNTSPADGDQG